MGVPKELKPSLVKQADRLGVTKMKKCRGEKKQCYKTNKELERDIKKKVAKKPTKKPTNAKKPAKKSKFGYTLATAMSPYPSSVNSSPPRGFGQNSNKSRSKFGMVSLSEIMSPYPYSVNSSAPYI